MYKRKDLPKEGDLVICTVKEISNFAVKVELDEYENCVGIIPIDEVTHKRIKTLKEIVEVGRKYVVMVLDVDEANRFLTLSLKRVSTGMQKMKMYQYKKERSAYKLIEALSEKLGIPIEKLNEEVVYKIIEKGKYLYEVWEEAYIHGPEKLKEYGIKDEYVHPLFELIKEKFKVREYIRQGFIEILSLHPDGIRRIKSVLLNLIEEGVEIKYESAPRYRFRIVSNNPKDLEQKYKKFLQKLDELTKKYELEYEIIET